MEYIGTELWKSMCCLKNRGIIVLLDKSIIWKAILVWISTRNRWHIQITLSQRVCFQWDSIPSCGLNGREPKKISNELRLVIVQLSLSLDLKGQGEEATVGITKERGS